MSRADWDSRFIRVAELVSGWSKDRRKKVGAVIVGGSQEIISTGYNGFPRGANDDLDERHEEPLKSMMVAHAEANAIYNAARLGAKTTGTTLYASWFPCSSCAVAIIQAGIANVIAPQPDFEHVKWGKSFQVSHDLLEECGVTIRYLS